MHIVTFKIKREDTKRMIKVYKENKKISEIIYEVS